MSSTYHPLDMKLNYYVKWTIKQRRMTSTTTKGEGIKSSLDF